MNAWTNFVTVGSKGFAWLLTWSWQALLLGGVWLSLKVWRTKSPSFFERVLDEDYIENRLKRRSVQLSRKR